MAELKTRVEELKMENEYQLRLKDMNYNEKIKELTEKFIQEMESLKTKNQVLKTDKDKEEAKHEEEIADFLEKHGKELQDLESANNQKLMSEYEKYQELQAKSQKMQEDYERQLTEMEESKEQALEELTEYYENKLTEKSAQLEQVITKLSLAPSLPSLQQFPLGITPTIKPHPPLQKIISSLGEERHCESKTLSVLSKNTTQCPRPGLEPGPLDLETSALTIRAPRLPQESSVVLPNFS